MGCPNLDERRSTLDVVSVDALSEAEEQIETWLCELDAEWNQLFADAHEEAAAIVAAARAEAADAVAAGQAEAAALVERAEAESRSLLAGTARLASMQLAEAQTEVVRARTLARESSAAALALADAADAAATGRVHQDDLAALGTAVVRLRAELSRVVDAAFDALPAVEATAAALHLDDQPDPSDTAAEAEEPVERTRRRGLRRLLRLGS